MTDDERAELDRLRAENQALRAQTRSTVDGGLSRLAQHAQRESALYARIQQGGLEVTGGDMYDSAYDAATIVMREMGLA